MPSLLGGIKHIAACRDHFAPHPAQSHEGGHSSAQKWPAASRSIKLNLHELTLRPLVNSSQQTWQRKSHFLYQLIFTQRRRYQVLSSKSGNVPPTADGKALFLTIAKELLPLGTTKEWQKSITD